MTNKKILRAIIADDHPVVILGVRACIERDKQFEVVATAGNTLELAKAIDTIPCDYLITDIGMEGTNGESNSIRVLKELLWQPGRPKVIVITMIQQSHMMARLIQMGVEGIIDKRDSLEYVSDAIATIESGKRYLSPGAVKTVYHLPAKVFPRAGALSRREWEVFRLYASGLMVADIAERFGRSSKTVASQKRTGMRKLGLENEGQLVEYFRQVGLV